MKSPLIVVLLIIVILVAVLVVYRTLKGPGGAKDFTKQAPATAKGPKASGQMQPMPAQPKGL